MIDMRYHVISLVAVFLALGIGILLGTTLVERGLVAEQKAQISSLRKTFDELKDANGTLRNQLDAYSRYADESRPYMITNMLPGKPFAILTSKKLDENAVARITDGIVAAGGSVPAIITIAGSDVFNNQAVVANLQTLFQMPGASAQDLKQRVFSELVNQLTTASNTGILATLQKIGVIGIRGSLTAPVSATVMLGPIETGSLDKSDVPMIKAFVATQAPVIGVTASSVENSVTLLYKKQGIATVDHVDTVPGEVALDMSLAGKPGNYGTGSAANRLLPPP